jgi:hypothetical protein
MRPQLRIYLGDDDAGAAVAAPPVPVTLGQIAKILADAVNNRRAWLGDFEDEEIQVSADLYDVLSAYWNMRRGA